MAKKKLAPLAPGRIILVSILYAIIVGTILLALPISQIAPIPFLDVFFTATSATCVTGLLTVPLSQFTGFGHFIILILMQLGGLGLITLMIFIVSLFVELGFSTQLMFGQIMEFESWKNIQSVILFIIFLTLGLEFVGACLIFTTIWGMYPINQAIFYSIFHAVSAFCNAGFYIFPHDISIFTQNTGFLLSTCMLMFAGGIGFITLNEIFYYFKSLRKAKHFSLSLSTKIVLYSALTLFCSTALIFWFIEQDNTLYNLPTAYGILNTMFCALSVKSTGFITVNPESLHFAVLLVIMLVAFIGSAPGSTGSGVKTTTIAIFFATIKAAITGRNAVEIRGRTIPTDQVHKALAIVALSAGWIFITCFCLLITDPHWEFLDILFEVVSAFATLGISLGITPYLSVAGKLFIILTMIIGRIGSLTLIIGLRKQTSTIEYSYPEERIMLS